MDWLTGLGVYCAKVLGMALSRQLTDEFQAWTPPLIKWLLAQAVKQLPPDQRDRYQQEWESHSVELPGQVAKVLHVLGCFLAARRIGHPFSWPSFVGRTADIVLAAGGGLLLAPLFVALALAIRLTSGGEVFERRPSIDRSGREFKALRFRVPRCVVHRIGGETDHVGGERSRPTWVGLILTRYSLDETPQFLNILRGEMSFFKYGNR